MSYWWTQKPLLTGHPGSILPSAMVDKEQLSDNLKGSGNVYASQRHVMLSAAKHLDRDPSLALRVTGCNSCAPTRRASSALDPSLALRVTGCQQLRPDQARIVGFGPFAGAQGDRVPTTGQGEYHKIRHSTQLLTKINPAIIRAACPHCERIFTTLSRIMIEEA